MANIIAAALVVVVAALVVVVAARGIHVIIWEVPDVADWGDAVVVVLGHPNFVGGHNSERHCRGMAVNQEQKTAAGTEQERNEVVPFHVRHEPDEES
jgi:hypothetical protein